MCEGRARTEVRTGGEPDQDWGKDELGLAGCVCCVPGSWTATLLSTTALSSWTQLGLPGPARHRLRTTRGSQTTFKALKLTGPVPALVWHPGNPAMCQTGQ